MIDKPLSVITDLVIEEFKRIDGLLARVDERVVAMQTIIIKQR